MPSPSSSKVEMIKLAIKQVMEEVTDGTKSTSSSSSSSDGGDDDKHHHRLLSKLMSQTTSKRLAERKVQKFDKNVIKRGSVLTKKGKNNYPVGPIMIGFFVFVVIGSSLFQIIRTATSGGKA